MCVNTSGLRSSRPLLPLVLTLLSACQHPSSVPIPSRPSATESQPAVSAASSTVPPPGNIQELLQTEPPDIERLVWALDGKSFAIVNAREVLLYDATTRQHTATLDAQEVSPVKGGGFVGIGRANWRPTLWGSDGREIASMSPDAVPPASEDRAKPSFLVSGSGQIAVLIQRAPKGLQATVWDLERRRIVRSLALTPHSNSLLS